MSGWIQNRVIVAQRKHEMRFIILVISLPLAGCFGYGGTVNLGTAPACMPYTFTATISPPTGVTGTIGTVTGIPASLTLTGTTLAGTPTWADIGAHPISATGTVTSTVPWYRSGTWSASSTLTITAPPITVTPPILTVPAFGMASNQVTVAVAPAGVTGVCPFSAGYPTTVPGLALMSVVPAPPQASDANDEIHLHVARDSNLPSTYTLPVTLTPTGVGGGNPIVVNIPVFGL